MIFLLLNRNNKTSHLLADDNNNLISLKNSNLFQPDEQQITPFKSILLQLIKVLNQVQNNANKSAKYALKLNDLMQFFVFFKLLSNLDLSACDQKENFVQDLLNLVKYLNQKIQREKCPSFKEKATEKSVSQNYQELATE